VRKKLWKLADSCQCCCNNNQQDACCFRETARCKIRYVSKFTAVWYRAVLLAIARLSCSVGLHKTHLFCKSAYRPFKVTQCHWLWYESKADVRLPISPDSNRGPVLPLFTDIAGFLFRNWPHSYSTLIFGLFPLNQIARVGISVSKYLKMFGREIIFEVFQPMWSAYLNVTDGRTDDLA